VNDTFWAPFIVQTSKLYSSSWEGLVPITRNGVGVGTGISLGVFVGDGECVTVESGLIVAVANGDTVAVGLGEREIVASRTMSI
jgi:hypothetical protein